jgi:hypothetical protein
VVTEHPAREVDLSRPTQQPYYYEKKIRLVTTIRENGARKAGKERERDEE